MSQQDLVSRLKGMRQPTLVVHGRFDAVLATETSWNVHQALPNSMFHVFEQSGHMPFIEEREAFIAKVTDFLSSIDAPTSGDKRGRSSPSSSGARESREPKIERENHSFQPQARLR